MAARRLGLVLGGGVLAALVYGGWAFAGIWLAAGIVGFAEWMVMSRTEPREVLIALGAATLGALLLCQRGGAPAPACIAVLLLGAAACATVARTAGGRLRALVGLLGAAAIAAVPVALRDDPGIGLVGPAWMFAVVWSTDIAAYFAGRKIGGPKLMPRVSPNKTWSGALGGLLGAVVAGTLVPVLADLAGMPPPERRLPAGGGWRERAGLRPEPGGRSHRVRSQAPLRREGFRKDHPGPWRRHGPARRILRRRRAGGGLSRPARGRSDRVTTRELDP